MVLPIMMRRWVINELFGRLNKAELGIADSPVSAAQLGAVLDLIADETISGSADIMIYGDVYTIPYATKSIKCIN